MVDINEAHTIITELNELRRHSRRIEFRILRGKFYIFARPGLRQRKPTHEQIASDQSKARALDRLQEIVAATEFELFVEKGYLRLRKKEV